MVEIKCYMEKGRGRGRRAVCPRQRPRVGSSVRVLLQTSLEQGDAGCGPAVPT